MNANIPPRAALLLDFISKGEVGTTGPEGYDIIVFNKQTKLPKPLTQYTIDELLSAQKTWAKNWGGSAAGRYQIIRKTLLGLMESLGIPGSTLFSPDVQDRLGYALLTQRGWQAFTSGQVTGSAYALQLAREWSSLPVLSTTKGAHRTVSRGESFYAGDGVNSAHRRADELESILTAARLRDPPAPKPIPIPAPVPQDKGLFGLLLAVVQFILSLFKKGKPK
jgi:muramidase (phage lysozyme)